jgi:predicted metal-dependent hydrolase
MTKREFETGILAVGDERVAFSVVRSRRRRRTIAFRMESDAHLRVLVPFSASLRSVARILQNRAPWIARQLVAQKKVAPVCDYSDGSVFMYLGYECILHVTQGENAPQSCILSPHVLRVHVPDERLSGDDLRQEVRLEIMLWLKKRARVILKRRMDIWAARMDVSYKKLILTDPERRWGSCSADNIIRLNWQLMKTPVPIVDYVVAHELAHIRHKNHSPRFWGFVAKAMPDYLARRKVLRQIERGIMY